jgi:hypothetical protein
MTAKDINQSSPREPWLRNTKHAFSITRIQLDFSIDRVFHTKTISWFFWIEFFFQAINLAWWKIKTTRKYNRKGVEESIPKKSKKKQERPWEPKELAKL